MRVMRRLMFIVFCISIFAACKKSQNNNGGTTTLPSGYYFIRNMSVITYDTTGARFDSAVTSYNYDAQGRSTNLTQQQFDVSFVHPQGQLLSSYSISYKYNSNNTIVVNEPNVQTSTYYVNSSTMLADSSYTSYNGGSGLVVYYFYDQNGYRKKDISYSIYNGQYSKSSEDDFTIVNGNVTQYITYNYNNIYSGLNDTVISNFPANPYPRPAIKVIDEYLGSYGITGQLNVNLPSSAISNITGTITSVNFYYTFDSVNRVNTMVEKLTNTGQIYATVRYNYY